MAKRDDQDAPANDAPLLIEGPKTADGAPGAIIDLAPLYSSAESDSATSEEAASPEAAAPPVSRWKARHYAPLAAGIVIALSIGALAGAAATATLLRDGAKPETIAAIDANRALTDSVAQLDRELASLKAGVVTAQRSATLQFGKLADRLDRAEKAQAEPTAKLAKIQESLDRLHQQQAAAAVPAPAATSSPEVTGSIAAAKEQSRPPLAEGWRMRDFYAGRAVVQNRNGTLFEVAPGSNLPGLGHVESIKRENGQVVLIAQNGTIAGTLAQRRPAYLLPYR